MVADAFSYAMDAWQRSVLFLDVLRKRGDEYVERTQQAVPNVLSFEAKLVVDGRMLARPVNYGLVEIVPPDGVICDSCVSCLRIVPWLTRPIVAAAEIVMHNATPTDCSPYWGESRSLR